MKKRASFVLPNGEVKNITIVKMVMVIKKFY